MKSEHLTDWSTVDIVGRQKIAKMKKKKKILQCLFRAGEVQISIFLGVIFTSGTNRLYREKQALSKT